MTATDDLLEVDDEVRTAEFEFELVRSADGGDGLTLSGYAAVFNSPTRISSWEGDFTEVIAPGAFKRTIRNGTPVMQFDHGQHPVIGSMPIASIRRLREDARGLYVEARVFDNWMTAPLRDAIRDGAVNGMSFRFQPVRDSWDNSKKDNPVRTLEEVRLHELGPVVFPAYSDTSVALRSLAAAVPDLAASLGTPDTPAPARTVDGPAAPVDPAPRHSIDLLAIRLADLRAKELLK